MSINRRRDLVLIALAVMITMPTLAEAPVGAIEFIRKNPGYRHAIESTVQGYESSLRTRCANVELDWDSTKVHVALQPTLDAQGHIENSVWVETVPGSACGQHRQYNAVVVFHHGQSSVLPSYPGESESNPILQQDTISYLRSALMIKGVLPKGCHIDVLETQLPNGRPQQRSPWSERWRVDACGKQYWTKVDYVPHATGTTGTTINVSPKDITSAK